MTEEARKAGSHRLMLADEAATIRLAADIAANLKPGDIVALSGHLGSGKSLFARAILRELADDPALEAPSPTFTLVQSYDTLRGTVLHADLYRVRSPDELDDIGLIEDVERLITLVEWPDRAGTRLPAGRRLDIVLDVDPDNPETGRIADLSGGVLWKQRLAIAVASRRLIDNAGWGEARRDFMLGDASTRAYERLTRPNGETAVLMISPQRPDGPPIRLGKPYSALAHLAESVDAFVAMDRGLRSLGYSAPDILAEDLTAGLLIIEDLGSEGVIDADRQPIAERYEAAARLLADLHRHTLPTILPVAEGRDHSIPPYDRQALAIETELILEWYAPHIAGVTLPAVTQAEFARIWSRLFDEILAQPSTWTLRDVHSPNLIWLEQREGHAKVGLIDFQDAVLGHPAYDLAALGQDARIDVPASLELRLLAAYGSARRADTPDFDLAAFARAYAILGAQRNTKIAGIFARLDKRDGKPGYLKHLPRIEAYLRRNLEHPALEELKVWYQAHMPKLFETEAAD
ncbi:tRNA (adenosine(37)-N6)-threonylcarbamoyltransferase complex ATPase subunit type 1 TsaE [Bosea sp. NBC_00550]|uniref:tRNA (adenosine(37)-N6)-threonylcarbamoyltransferase complex ATPase subunit type 1 TsaE n=1 Tax=Bosea sp. NBC_00550 TaxID=2969621 RepID=UPI00223298D0|nr:tRNA (adenosine(37)-N6)-threonylcarbamoyltransferase complex ATPase subunit type 1 TsaE [Bosea sp. NBC_00550]UZF91969.1 tRNA (adenosine(37)-N6)-threonylcarbamoyltransferase complex ATPase subunit type 1 TsaE [Bosea sp. NBC_00550]